MRFHSVTFSARLRASASFNSTPITLRMAAPQPAVGAPLAHSHVHESVRLKARAEEGSVSRQRRHASRKTDGATAE